MDVVLWCPYEDHRVVRPFAQLPSFSGFIRCGTNVRTYHPKVLGDFWPCPEDSTLATSPSYLSSLWLSMGRVTTTYHSSWGCCGTWGSLGLHLWLSTLILQGFPSLCHSIEGWTTTMWSCTFIANLGSHWLTMYQVETTLVW